MDFIEKNYKTQEISMSLIADILSIYSDEMKKIIDSDLEFLLMSSIIKLTTKKQKNWINNLVAQSHVAVSFEVPEYTANADALGTLRILEAIKFHKLTKKTNFIKQEHLKCMDVCKLHLKMKNKLLSLLPYGGCFYAHWITKNYREAYNIFACNGILFNHESPRRGETLLQKRLYHL